MDDWIVYTGIFLVMVAVIAAWFLLEKTYNCRIRVREIVKGRRIIKDFRAKSMIDSDGQIWWLLIGEKKKQFKKIYAPPEEAIELNAKGKKCAECYRFESGEIQWIQDSGDVKEFPADEIQIPDTINDIEEDDARESAIEKYKKLARIKWYKDNNIISPLQPLTTKQRTMYISQLRKAEDRNKHNDWKQMLIPALSLGVIALIVVMGMIMWQDLTSPLISARQFDVQEREIQVEMMEITRDIKLGQQRLDDKISDMNVPD